MSKTSTEKRTYLLQQGVELLSEVGLNQVTLGLLATRAAVSKSGLFAHFDSKENLQIALLDYTAELANQAVVAPALLEADGLPRLRSLVQHWLGWSTRAGLPGGCPVAAALFELDDIESGSRDKVVELESHWRSFLSSLVQRCIELGDFRPETDVDQFVWELCGIYLSHHTSLRFLRDAQSNSRAFQAFETLIYKCKRHNF